MPSIRDAIASIRQHGDVVDIQRPGASASEIRKAELLLGTTLPAEYRIFVEELGDIGLFGIRIYGIVLPEKKGERRPNSIDRTLEHRELGLDPQILVIGETGDGGVYAIKPTSVSGKADPVIIWWPGADRSSAEEAVAESLAAFLLQLLRDELEG